MKTATIYKSRCPKCQFTTYSETTKRFATIYYVQFICSCKFEWMIKKDIL